MNMCLHTYVDYKYKIQRVALKQNWDARQQCWSNFSSHWHEKAGLKSERSSLYLLHWVAVTSLKGRKWFSSNEIAHISALFSQLAADQSLKFAYCRGGWGERSCKWSTKAIQSVAVDRTRKLPIERWIFDHWAIAAPHIYWLRIDWKPLVMFFLGTSRINVPKVWREISEYC